MAAATITKKQWDLLNEATSIAKTMADFKAQDLKRNGFDSTMYEEWFRISCEAKEALIEIGITPYMAWSKEEAA